MVKEPTITHLTLPTSIKSSNVGPGPGIARTSVTVLVGSVVAVICCLPL